MNTHSNYERMAPILRGTMSTKLIKSIKCEQKQEYLINSEWALGHATQREKESRKNAECSVYSDFISPSASQPASQLVNNKNSWSSS